MYGSILAILSTGAVHAICSSNGLNSGEPDKLSLTNVHLLSNSTTSTL